MLRGRMSLLRRQHAYAVLVLLENVIWSVQKVDEIAVA
jgi:hypothetical protein